jgi:hypothetical protein
MVSNKSNQKTKKKRDFSELILNFLLMNPSGVTITDIAKGISTSRITASKYVSILEAKNRVTTEQIGAYTLYFNVQKDLIPKSVAFSFYLGLLKGLKEDITEKEKLKKFGKNIAEFMRFPYGSSISDEALTKDSRIDEKYLKFIGDYIFLFNFMHERKPKVTTQLTGDMAIYTISNIDLFEKSEYYDVHYYIASGVLEKIASRRFPKASCNVEEIDIEKQIVKLSLKLN